MYKLKFANTYDFAIMRENNIPAVTEDFYAISRNIFCVADGVTRDLKDGNVFKYPTTKEKALDLIAKYPNPSGASLASKLCATSFLKYASMQNEVSEQNIIEIVRKINEKIWSINKTRTNIDYISEDLYGCVAVGGIITNDYLYCFSIGDCRIKLLDENFNILFDTVSLESTLAPYEVPEELAKKYNSDCGWHNKECRAYYRKNVRNNAERLHDGKYSFGVLTGEASALNFVNVCKISLDNTKYILAYSDGCEDCLDTREKTISVIENPEQIKNEVHEKTLLIYEKD